MTVVERLGWWLVARSSGYLSRCDKGHVYPSKDSHSYDASSSDGSASPSVVAIIAFRAGSKGVNHKNTRTVAGQSLWHWSWDAAYDSNRVNGEDVSILYRKDRILITTDAHGDKSLVGFEYINRPPELATDTALLDDVLIHAADVSHLSDDTTLVILQPTVPVRRPGLIDDCLDMFERFPEAKSLLTVNALHYVWHGDSGTRAKVLNPPRVNRQDMDSAQKYYHEDGSVFIVHAGDLRRTKSRVVEPVVLFETETTVDIDSEADMELAGYLLSRGEDR